MKASELAAWALSLMDFEVPIELEEPAGSAYPIAAQPETRVRFRFYDPLADEAVEMHVGQYSSLVNLAERINRLGSCGATYYDPERQRLVIQSAIRHKGHHAVGVGLADQEVGEKEATLNWLVDVMSLAQEAIVGVARMRAFRPDP